MSVVNIYAAAEARQTILRRAVGRSGDAPAGRGRDRARLRRAPEPGRGRRASCATCACAGTRPWPSGPRIDGAAVTPEIRAMRGPRPTVACPPRSGTHSIWPRSASPRSIASSRWTRGSTRGLTARWANSSGRSTAGVYVPGGTAPLPSSLLMAAIPRVAGVGQVIVCTPPRQGGVADLILAAAHVAGVDLPVRGGRCAGHRGHGLRHRVRARGGQDRGRGRPLHHAGQAAGDRQRRHRWLLRPDGDAGHRGRARTRPGPPRTCWRQAEHDVLASPILLTPSAALAGQVAAELAVQLATLSRADIAATSLRTRRGIVVTDDLAEAVELANAYAAEHLCLLVRGSLGAGGPHPQRGRHLRRGALVRGAGRLRRRAEPRHADRGAARYSSPLSVADFVKRISLAACSARTRASGWPAPQRSWRTARG